MVNIQPQQQTQQPISDDQELAQVLAGVSQQNTGNAMQFEETPAPTPPLPTMPVAPVAPVAPAVDPAPVEPVVAPQVDPVVEEPEFIPPARIVSDEVVSDEGDLQPIKTEAVNELRPLVDKLTLPPEEKFDTYLLLLRSTDDRSLIAPAHTAAQAITDEARKAQALLDIIKEIDFLSNPQS